MLRQNGNSEFPLFFGGLEVLQLWYRICNYHNQEQDDRQSQTPSNRRTPPAGGRPAPEESRPGKPWVLDHSGQPGCRSCLTKWSQSNRSTMALSHKVVRFFILIKASIQNHSKEG